MAIKKHSRHHCSLPEFLVLFREEEEEWERKEAGVWGAILVQGGFPVPGCQGPAIPSFITEVAGRVTDHGLSRAPL